MVPSLRSRRLPSRWKRTCNLLKAIALASIFCPRPCGIERRGTLDHEPAQGGFITQDEIVDHKDASERIRRKTHADRKPATLHVLVEVEERQKRSRILADEIKLRRCAASGEIARYRLPAEGSSKGELLDLVAAFRKSQLGPGDDLLVVSAENSGFDIELDLLDRGRIRRRRCSSALPAARCRRVQEG